MNDFYPCFEVVLRSWKPLCHICQQSQVIAFYVSSFVAMAKESVVYKFDVHHWIAWPPNNPCMRKDFGDISCLRRVINDFVSYFVAIERMSLVVEFFFWHHSIARPPNPLLGASISAMFSIVAELLPFLSQISLFDVCLAYKTSYGRFCLKFRCHGNGGRSWQNFSKIIK